MMRVEPLCERPVGLTQREDALCIFDRRVDFQSITDNPGIVEQLCATPRVKSRDTFNHKIVKCLAERIAFFQNREPRESGLIDLQHETLE